MKKLLVVIEVNTGVIATGYLVLIVKNGVDIYLNWKAKKVVEQSTPGQSHYSGSDTGARAMGFHPAE